MTGGLKPSALSAAGFELVMFRLATLSVRSVTTPPLTVDGVEVPVIEFDLSEIANVCGGQVKIGDVELIAGRWWGAWC